MMEVQLREQATLARLGEMAAVIAHEVKNPLAGIRGAIQVIGGRLPAASRDAAMTKEIVARIDALNGLMKDLLLFASRGAGVNHVAIYVGDNRILHSTAGAGGVVYDDLSTPRGKWYLKRHVASRRVL